MGTLCERGGAAGAASRRIYVAVEVSRKSWVASRAETCRLMKGSRHPERRAQDEWDWGHGPAARPEPEPDKSGVGSLEPPRRMDVPCPPGRELTVV